MIQRTVELTGRSLAAYDAVVDVRSPAEFALDHVPGAINLPVLDDDERARIGTEYVQGSKYLARRRGAALVARNIARHLEDALSGVGGGFKPLVYCWRGGQRSHAMATVMDQVGWPVSVVHGGYQTWRRRVVAALHDRPLVHRLAVIDGPTGSGKTALLARLAADGEQVVDLEALANHRGSLFGAEPGGQPSQKLFETRLHAALDALDPARPTWVEAESSRIGDLTVPPSLWAAMKAAPVVALDTPLDRRVRRILDAYAAFAADPAAVDALLNAMPRHIGKATIDDWRALAASGDMPALVRALIEGHYDPAYRRSRRSDTPSPDPDLLAAAARHAEEL